MGALDAKVQIQGTLSSSKQEFIQPNTANKISDALRSNGLKLFAKEKQWSQGSVEFNEQNLSFGGRYIAKGIVSALRDFLRSEGVKELALTGQLLITVGSFTSPAVIRVSISEGILSYQQANIQWEPELVIA